MKGFAVAFASIGLLYQIGATDTAQQHEKVLFVREYEKAEASHYRIVMHYATINVTYTTEIEQRVLKFLENKKPMVRMRVVSQVSSLPATQPLVLPMTTRVTKYNIPDNATIQKHGNEYVYLILGLAESTADGKVHEGGVYPIQWRSRMQALTVKGDCKIVNIDNDSYTKKVDLSIALDEDDLGSVTLTSVHDKKTGHLMSSTGTWDVQAMKWDLKIDAIKPKPAVVPEKR